MKTILELKELMDQIAIDAKRCEEKGTISRGRNARKNLSLMAKLCKEARQEILERMKESESERQTKKKE